MRPLAGMAAHRSDCSARGVPRHYPDRIEALSVHPVREFSPDVAEIGRFEGLEPDSWESRPAHVEGLGASWRGVGYRVLQWRHGMPNMWGPDPNRTPRPLALGRDVLDYLQHGE
jgi:hypothetical protein